MFHPVRLVSTVTFIMGALLILSGCGLFAGPAKAVLSVQATVPTAGVSGLKAPTKAFPSLTGIVAPIKDTTGAVVGGILLTNARVALGTIRIELGTEDTKSEADRVENAKIRFPGPYLVDLVKNTVTPSLGTNEMNSTTYKQIRMILKKLEGVETNASGQPLIASTDGLKGNSIYLAGLYTGATSNQGVVSNLPFVYAFSLEEEMELTPAGQTSLGFSLTGGDNPVVIAFRLAKWFAFQHPESNIKNLNMSGLTVNSGSIILDANVSGFNGDIRSAIKENIKRSADYGVDQNRDGSLDSAEDASADDSEDQ